MRRQLNHNNLFLNIAPRLVIGGIYKHIKEMMKLPWTSDIAMNTIHVKDLVKAVHFLIINGKHGEVSFLTIKLCIYIQFIHETSKLQRTNVFSRLTTLLIKDKLLKVILAV